ncbi:hypothetical protein SISSUDRAFT_810223 [Sistotremastrum suecicum HHB10207 ss-3]|uniref:Uncharacterized protein n=1 Tax=Sistotremastrum suecicum HHB10207 ss-3 TaxID=1314776 RepID=A0A166CXV0_9AGAM|nr:hypothetical protein SISSUDRAFT_810223 [Sistotremastrum suecicum HHB10207 ss-3]
MESCNCHSHAPWELSLRDEASGVTERSTDKESHDEEALAHIYAIGSIILHVEGIFLRKYHCSFSCFCRMISARG